MATKTNNLGLSKAELTDAVRSTLIANNGNFDKIDDQIARLKANQITGTANGTEIVVEDSAEMESILHISGNSEQDSRSGKNMFDEVSLLGDYLTDGYYNFSVATLRDVVKSKIEAIDGFRTDTQYTISFTGYFTTGVWAKFTFYYTDGTSKLKTFNENVEANYIFTSDVGKTVDYIELEAIYWADGKNIFIKENTLQLEEGSTATPYEPYGAMPSPDYPSEIRSVSGDVEAKVENKNLIDLSQGIYDRNRNPVNVTAQVRVENNKFYTNRTGYGYHGFGFLAKVNPGSTYTFSANVEHLGTKNSVTAKAQFEVYDTVNKVSLGYIKTPDLGLASITVTLPENCTEILCAFNNVGVSSSYLGNHSIFGNIMLEKGSTATQYVPYQAKTISLPLGDIELRSTPDGTRDTFERVDGVWNKVANNTSTIFDGSDDEGWLLQHASDNGNEFKLSNIPNGNGTANDVIYPLLCSHLKPRTQGDVFNGEMGIQLLGNTVNALYVCLGNKFTLAEFKTWLSSNPIEVVYRLAEPTYTPITDPALIQALDELEQLILNKGYNRITVTSVNGVKAYLDLSYVKDINIVLDNINATMLALGGGTNV